MASDQLEEAPPACGAFGLWEPEVQSTSQLSLGAAQDFFHGFQGPRIEFAGIHGQSLWKGYIYIVIIITKYSNKQ